MSRKYTTKDVRRMVELYEEQLHEAGIMSPTQRLHYESGSPTYDRAHRLALMTDDGKGAHFRPILGDDYLGWTCEEAWRTVQQRYRTVSDMVQVLTEQGRWEVPT